MGGHCVPHVEGAGDVSKQTGVPGLWPPPSNRREAGSDVRSKLRPWRKVRHAVRNSRRKRGRGGRRPLVERRREGTRARPGDQHRRQQGACAESQRRERAWCSDPGRAPRVRGRPADLSGWSPGPLANSGSRILLCEPRSFIPVLNSDLSFGDFKVNFLNVGHKDFLVRAYLRKAVSAAEEYTHLKCLWEHWRKPRSKDKWNGCNWRAVEKSKLSAVTATYVGQCFIVVFNFTRSKKCNA